MPKPKQHGGPRKGAGRHQEPGYQKTIKARFLSLEEEELLKQLTPRQRIEILLAHIRQGAI